MWFSNSMLKGSRVQGCTPPPKAASEQQKSRLLLLARVSWQDARSRVFKYGNKDAASLVMLAGETYNPRCNNYNG
jgi:hypothetical protein